ncbi:MAG: dienelactone hydrolase family protein [Neisseria zoodegmatis]|uniref:dienelactone hydrolase family protein n=1 Tax=Neisseria zoodegmatis TaxID=326523 RepID=UPI0026F2DD8C|nr:dienelactone hydrolase family protein [Neisseria zoodegmatis]MDO5070761.1 dienelactone hydrolase family protein [Neisseria zoodegmatis]
MGNFAKVSGFIKGELLIEHAGKDVLVSDADVAAFRQEMDAAKVRYHIDVFPEAKHGFTNPQATRNGEKNGSDADVAAFRQEMDAAKVRYHIDVFPEAKHGFTNPQATRNGEKNGVDLAYNEADAEQAWQNMLDLLERTL